MTRALAEQESGGEAMVIVQQISSYLLLSCGILYIITVSSLLVNLIEKLIQTRKHVNESSVFVLGNLMHSSFKTSSIKESTKSRSSREGS